MSALCKEFQFLPHVFYQHSSTNLSILYIWHYMSSMKQIKYISIHNSAI